MVDIIREYWPILFVFIAMLLSFVRSNMKVVKEVKEYQPETPPADAIPEEFPQMKILETLKSAGGGAKQTAKKAMRNPQNNTASKLQEVPAAPKSNRKCMLKGKGDVKKAFIYSEIINRKYN